MENKIKVINSTVEEIDLPEKVDIIVSEWMGYFLWFEGMFDSVIFAAKKWLKEDGLLFPNLASFSFAACDYPEPLLDEQYNVLLVQNNKPGLCGDLGLLNKLKEYKRMLGDVFIFNPKQIQTDEQKLQVWNLEKVEKEDLDFSQSFVLKVNKDGHIGGIVCWFDTTFSHGEQKIVLDTSPFKESTHWKQGYFQMRRRLPVRKGDLFEGQFSFSKNKYNPRNIDVTLEYRLENEFLKIRDRESFFFQ